MFNIVIENNVFGVGILLFPTLILAYFLGQKFKILPEGIWALIVSVSLGQFLNGFDIHSNCPGIISIISGFSISLAMLQIGLEVESFSLLKNSKVWIFLISVIIVTGLVTGISFSWMSLTDIELLGVETLSFVSSLAVMILFLGGNRDLYQRNMIQILILLVFLSDCILWIDISILESLKKNISFLDIILFIITMIIVVSVKRKWLGSLWNGRCWYFWMLISGMLAIMFFNFGLSPVLGSIFGGLLVPNESKHKLEKQLTPFFDVSMKIYMATVGLKIHESIFSVEVLEIALCLVFAMFIGKGFSTFLAIKMKVLSGGEFLHTKLFLFSPGTMGIAAVLELSSSGVVPEVFVPAMVLVVVFLAITVAIVLKKKPLGNKNRFRLCGNFLKLNY